MKKVISLILCLLMLGSCFAYADTIEGSCTVIGADLDAIKVGEDRKLFAEAMADIGLEVARSGFAYSLADAEAIVAELGFPAVVRPSFTLGGAGGGVVY